MCRVQPGLQLADAHLILVLEDVPGADGPGSLQLLVLLQPGTEGEGAAGVEVEGDGDAVVAGRQYPGVVSQVRVSIGSRSVLSFITIRSF